MPAVKLPTPTQKPSTDGHYSRNSTRIIMQVTPPSFIGKKFNVGRIQSMSENIANNVQVLDELGQAYAVELKKGITHFTFTVARFLTRKDAFEPLKAGQIFGLSIYDLVPNPPDGENTIEFFGHCSITSIAYSYSVGQAVVGVNASIVTIGRGHGFPAGLPGIYE